MVFILASKMNPPADTPSPRVVAAVIRPRGPSGWWGGCLLALCLLAGVSSGARAQSAGYKLLHQFDYANLGITPMSGLTLGSDGNLYGVTYYDGGGPNGSGSVFQITPDGTVTPLHIFDPLPYSSINVGGGHPMGGLIQGSDGNFYGTTTQGGTNGQGTIFQITPQGAFTTLHNFDALDPNMFNEGGSSSGTTLFQGRDGYFYGTSGHGGENGTGLLFRFKLTPGKTTVAINALHSFAGPVTRGINADGADPINGVVEGSDGNFYGTVTTGGANGNGVIYIYYAGGGFRVVHTFSAKDSSGRNSDGAGPSTLTFGRDGKFHGSTYSGGKYGKGTVFSFAPGGTLESFNFGEPTASGDVIGNPVGAFIEASNGSLYGVTTTIDGQNYGTVYQVGGAPGGVLHTFDSVINVAGVNVGQMPVGALVEGAPGIFYGITSAGGQYDGGVAFQLSAPPVITSPGKATASVDTPFTYQITATLSPISYSARLAPGQPSVSAAASPLANLGHGLFFDFRTGIISGTPTSTGAVEVFITASNAAATGSGSLIITIGAR